MNRTVKKQPMKKESKKSLGKLINLMILDFLMEYPDGLSEAELIDNIIQGYGLEEVRYEKGLKKETTEVATPSLKSNSAIRQSIRGQVRRALEALTELDAYLDFSREGNTRSIRFGKKYGVEITDTKFAEEYNEKNIQGFMVQAEAENKVYIEGPTEYLPEIKKAGAELKKVDDLGSQLDKIAAQAATMAKSLTNSADKILGGFMSMKDTAENMILLAFKILYGIFIVIAVILMTILTLYVLINCFLFKIPLHVMWNIALLICILNFFLGAILGIFGYVTSIIAPTIAYFISPEFLSNQNSPINAPSPIPECINTCLNGDGNIYKVFGVENMLKNTKEFNEVMTIAAKIVNTADELNNYKSSAEKYEKRLEGYEKDLTTLTVGSKNGDLTALLEKANKNSKNNKYVLNEKECPSSKAETDCTDSVGSKCFLIENCKTSSDNEVKKIAEYVASLKEALTKEKQSITSLKGSFETAIGTVKTPINSAKKTVNELVILINKYMSGDADLIQMFNCGFLGKDLIVFMDQLYFKFSGSCKGMAIACGVGAVLSYFGAIMVLRAVYRNGPKARDNSKKSGHKKLDNHEHDHEHDKEATHQLDTETFHIMPKPKQ